MSIEECSKNFNKSFMRGWIEWKIMDSKDICSMFFDELYDMQDDEFGLYIAGGEL